MNRINKVKNSNLRPGIKRRLLRNMAHVWTEFIRKGEKNIDSVFDLFKRQIGAGLQPMILKFKILEMHN